MSDKNIFQRLAGITAELPIVAKKLFVETSQGKGYNAVSEADILNAVKPLETKYGVYSYPVTRDIVDSEILESETQYGKKSTFFSRIRTVYRFVNVDDPEDYIETVTFSEGIDSQDKGSGKAMTYADKYALMKAYKISTGEDPDKEASDEAYYEMVQKKSFDMSKCADCGEAIAENVAKYSLQKYKRPLCWECQGKAKNAIKGVATRQEGQ